MIFSEAARFCETKTIEDFYFRFNTLIKSSLVSTLATVQFIREAADVYTYASEPDFLIS